MAVSWWRDLCRLLALLAVITSPSAAQKKRKPVTAALTAKWGQTPFVLEVRALKCHDSKCIKSNFQAAEYLNSENPDYFWTFVSDLSELDTWPGMTASEQHEVVMRLAAKSLSPAQVKLLQFALSLKTESPKIEMYSHLAIDR